MGYIKEFLPKVVRYRMARIGLMNPGVPLNLTFSVTNLCQSKCKTCNIWELYKTHPEKRDQELSIEEIEKIFRSIGHIYVFNISGGEPFLRSDLPEIVKLACKHLTPGVIHIPTNAIALGEIERKIKDIIGIVGSHDPSIQLTVKPSLDHIGGKHDEIRGVRGNYEKVIALFNKLKVLGEGNSNFHAELGTVISRWNVDDVEEIAQFITGLDVDSYRNEIAEQRSEMFNEDNQITPSAEQYEKAIGLFVNQIKENMKNRLFFQRMTNAFRLVYYDLAIRILKEGRQVIPCYGGISNVHLNPYGDVWACCTLGYEKTMGNLRETDFDFEKTWNSTQAQAVRSFIRKGNCSCPLANQTYSNILLHPSSILRILSHIMTPN